MTPLTGRVPILVTMRDREDQDDQNIDQDDHSDRYHEVRPRAHVPSFDDSECSPG